MSENRKIRLSGVAREYNVGVTTLIEFVQSKGVTAKLSPNTQIEGEILDLIRAEFGKGKVERVDIRAKIRPSDQSVGIEDVERETDKVDPSPEKEVIIKSNTIFSPAKELAGPKIVGKVDLSAGKKEEKPKQEKKIAPKSEAPKITKTAVKPEKTPKKEETTPSATKIVDKPVSITKKETEPKVEVQSPKATSATQEIKPAVKDKKETEKEVVKEEVVKAKKEEPKIFRANERELAGVTVVGKIDLSETTTGRDSSRRGRRSRIKRNKVDIAKSTTTPQAGGAKGQPAKAGEAAGARKRRPAAAGGRKGVLPRRGVPRAEVSEEDVQKQIKETLARLTNKRSSSRRGARYRRDKREAIGEKIAQEAAQQQERMSSTLQVTEFVTVSELASMMDVNVNKVITACMNLGLMVSINQRLDAEALAIVADEFGFEVEFVSVDIQETIDAEEEDDAGELEERPPIVTVMGHVDHGKTSLLDHIRQANVIAGEAGGITQHIGAYSVKLDNGKRITFLDTPGHEAFTAMRARGAKVTDVVIIIVAADDAMMPQTEEAINHAAAAGVPMVFAINKIDKPTANPEKIKEQLAAKNYLVEDWGGKYQSQEVSAKTGLNVEKLLEKVILESDILDLKANPNRAANGSVIESTLDKGRGYVTTVLVQNGTLKIGDVILSGTHTGRVRAMFNERGQEIKAATPSTPVLVLGLNGAPQAGDSFNVMEDDKQAREIANKRDQLQRMQDLRTQKHITLDEIGRRIAIGTFQELNIIVKGDVDGSVEALTDSLLKLGHEEIQLNVIHKGVGQISESDVLLATASNAIIVGFQVRPSATARRMAEKEEIDIRLYSVIYDAINEIKDALEGMLEPETKEQIICSVEVLELFKSSGIGTIAGCIVREGKITRNTRIRVIRDGIVVYTGKLGSLKRFKDDVREVTVGHECGLNIESFNDVKVGDFVEGYEEVEVARTLSK